MGVYLIPIEYGLIIFPIIALIICLPVIFINYRKYGYNSIFKSVLFYSFILYMLIAYFMVILPLPSRNEVANYTTKTMQLIPFKFVAEIIKDIKEFGFLKYFTKKTFYMNAFNLVLTIPFGIYVRYYKNCDMKKVALATFCLSLFYELTQLSGLYFIYPRPYRLFDVDDLIINTAGGIVGYYIAPLFFKLIPTYKQLEKSAYERGKNVTVGRRIMALAIDEILILFLNLVVIIVCDLAHFNYQDYTYLISPAVLIVYYFFVLTGLSNDTLGKKLVKISLCSVENKKYKIYFHNLISIFVIRNFTMIFSILSLIRLNWYIYLIFLIVFVFWYISNIIHLFKEKRTLYDDYCMTELVSTIQIK